LEQGTTSVNEASDVVRRRYWRWKDTIMIGGKEYKDSGAAEPQKKKGKPLQKRRELKKQPPPMDVKTVSSSSVFSAQELASMKKFKSVSGMSSKPQTPTATSTQSTYAKQRSSSLGQELFSSALKGTAVTTTMSDFLTPETESGYSFIPRSQRTAALKVSAMSEADYKAAVSAATTAQTVKTKKKTRSVKALRRFLKTNSTDQFSKADQFTQQASSRKPAPRSLVGMMRKKNIEMQRKAFNDNAK
jgi:hypothetical protein